MPENLYMAALLMIGATGVVVLIVGGCVSMCCSVSREVVDWYKDFFRGGNDERNSHQDESAKE